MRRSVHHHRPAAAAGVPAAVGRGGCLRRGIAARVRRRRRRGRGRGHHYRPCTPGHRDGPNIDFAGKDVGLLVKDYRLLSDYLSLEQKCSTRVSSTHAPSLAS